MLQATLPETLYWLPSEEAKQLLTKVFNDPEASSLIAQRIMKDPNINELPNSLSNRFLNPLYYGEKFLIVKYICWENPGKIPIAELHKQLFPQEEPDLPKTSPSTPNKTTKENGIE